MSDKTNNDLSSGTADVTGSQSAGGNAHPTAAKTSELAAAAATPAVAQGLQSVMAVIGENYDPAVSGSLDKTTTPSSSATAAAAPKLTDKIDAARGQQDESPTVTKGLQSIMAVIGENYEEEPELVAADPRASSDAPLRPQLEMQAAPKPLSVAPQDAQNAEATSAISDLLPMLTDDEQGMAQLPLPTVVPGNEIINQPSQAVVANDPTVSDLLNQLKSDISTLERGNMSAREQFNMPAVIDSASEEVRTLLAELQGDISALRSENDNLKTQYNVPTVMAGQGTEVTMLLNQLQGDIAGLRSENDALKNRTPGGGSEISTLLAQLQGDISGLRKENDSYKAYYNGPEGRPRGTTFGQAVLMTIGLVSLVGGATLGGMYYANTINSKNNENLMALLGLQQAQKEAASKTEARAPKKVVVAEKKVAPPPARVAAVAPPPALPRITVKRPKLDSAEVQALLADAQNLIELGDLVSARQMLEYAMSQRSAEAAYRLAKTFDPLHLATMASVLSVEPNITRAKVLYYSAARQGHQAASKRLAELRRTPGR